ncbi:hypothetical protein V492_06093 [Pseudogymnoascus sp. VKM F-4246]|nr:hypothetical protein V492_06093 [Pseudogymnoascus sp. VKM F-4246]
MSCEANSENCRKESQEFGHSEEGDRCDNSDEGPNGNLQQNVDNDKTLSSDIGATGVIDPCADKHVHEEPVLVVTPEWQRQSWLLEVSQSAEDSPESVTSVNSENESDGGSWTFEDGPDANMKSYELQIQNMTSINEALKARARKAEKEQSERDEAFKRELKNIHFKHAESLQAKQEHHDHELSEKIRAKDELFYNHGRLMGKYHTACEQIKDQTEKIKDLDAKLATHAEVLNQVKAPDGSIFTHKQRQDIVDDLKRDTKAQKEFYRNQIKTLEHQVARKTTRLNKGIEESHELENKLLALTNELSNEQHKCRDVQAKLELETKSHLDVEETAKRNFDSQIQEAQATAENQGKQIQQMDTIIRSLQAHLVATQQSYAAAMGTVQNFHRAQEKSI